ncbi:MAG: PocR ligand-binding domain-containing protein [Lentimicrobiaceae bacterium]|jgi:ligand-binding sensor protein
MEYVKNTTCDPINDLKFNDIFITEDIRHLLDLFPDATGEASIITHPDNSHITKLGNFCRLCDSIIRKTEKGFVNCHISDEANGGKCTSDMVIQRCWSGGLWNTGAGALTN